MLSYKNREIFGKLNQRGKGKQKNAISCINGDHIYDKGQSACDDSIHDRGINLINFSGLLSVCFSSKLRT